LARARINLVSSEIDAGTKLGIDATRNLAGEEFKNRGRR
jgi:hypothetical protein